MASGGNEEDLPDFMADIDAALAGTGVGDEAEDDFDDFGDVDLGNASEVCFPTCEITRQ